MSLYCSPEEIVAIEKKKREFIDFMIHSGIRYTVCGEMSAAMNEVIAKIKEHNAPQTQENVASTE